MEVRTRLRTTTSTTQIEKIMKNTQTETPVDWLKIAIDDIATKKNPLFVAPEPKHNRKLPLTGRRLQRSIVEQIKAAPVGQCVPDRGWLFYTEVAPTS